MRLGRPSRLAFQLINFLESRDDGVRGVLRSLADGLLGGQEMNALVHGCKCFSRGRFWFLLWFLLLCKERGSPRLSLQQVQLSFLSCFIFVRHFEAKLCPLPLFGLCIYVAAWSCQSKFALQMVKNSSGHSILCLFVC